MLTQYKLASDIVIILLTAFLGGLIARKLRIPLMLGYLAGGIFTGNIIVRFIPLEDSIRNIAEIGVALLLFTLGLEFSLQKLKELGDVIIFGSLIQIILTIIGGLIIFPILGLDFYTSLFLGCAFSLSSTAVMLKILSDRGEIQSLHGEMVAGWLFMQDLYTLPLFIILPAIGRMNMVTNFSIITIGTFIQSLLMASVSFFLVIFLGHNIVPWFIEKIADLKNHELIIIASVTICLTFAFIFQILGLSFALGAFIAGILIAQSSANHGIFAEIRPLRDVFATIFFVSLGLMLKPTFFIANWPILFALTFFIIFLKLFISFLIVIILGFHTRIAALVSLSLISVGEFAFILGLSGSSSKLINEHTYLIILSVTFITLIISIPISQSSHHIYHNLRQLLVKKIPILHKYFKKFERTISFDETMLSKHVIVLGYGRVGKYICRALSFTSVPFIVVDYNHQVVRTLRNENINVVYGDPSQRDVLRFANASQAKVLIVAYQDRFMQEVVVENALYLNPDIKIICRTHFEEDQKKLKSLGVETVIQPEFEASLSITEKLLHLYGISDLEIGGKITRLKIEHGML